MQLLLATIAAGGLVGAADQYLCLLLVGAAGRAGWIELAPSVQFMTSTWFIGLTVFLWIITILPAYSAFFAPGVMNVINTLVRFVSGFAVPISSAFIALASAGVIADLNPELRLALETLRIFNGGGGVDVGGWGVMAASAVTAVTLTGAKAAAKPGLAAMTGTTGHLSAPLFTTVENIAAVVLMLLAYWFSKINPWLLVGLLAVVLVVVLILVGWAFYQLWKLKQGMGRVLYLAQVHPRAGLAVAVEFLVWGLGWLVWGKWGRAVLMLAILIIFVAVAFTMISGALVLFFPLGVAVAMMLFSIYVLIGFKTAGALLNTLEKQVLVDEGIRFAEASR